MAAQPVLNEVKGDNLPIMKRAYTLVDCLQEGLENNYSLKVVKNEQRISDNNATWGNAGFLPSLDISSSYRGNAQDTETKLREENSVVKENGIFNQTIDAGVNLNWTIFEGFSIRTNYKKLKELQAQGELDTRIAVENLIADLTAEYYNYIQQRLRLKNFRYAVAHRMQRMGWKRTVFGKTDRQFTVTVKKSFRPGCAAVTVNAGTVVGRSCQYKTKPEVMPGIDRHSIIFIAPLPVGSKLQSFRRNKLYPGQ